MLSCQIKELTLYDFDRLANLGFGDLLNPETFLDVYGSWLKTAKATHCLATFNEPRVSLQRWLESIKGEDLKTLHDRFFEAYRDFFPPRARDALNEWKRATDAAKNRLTEEPSLPGGGTEP